MVKEVARSYGELKDSLGFKAFEKSRAYAAAKQEIRKMAVTKSSEMPGYWYVDYKNAVIVRDLLGDPNAERRTEASKFLQTILPVANQQLLSTKYSPVGMSDKMPSGVGTSNSVLASNRAVVASAIALVVVVHYAAHLLKPFVTRLLM